MDHIQEIASVLILMGAFGMSSLRPQIIQNREEGKAGTVPLSPLFAI
jgi:hypothetical protein